MSDAAPAEKIIRTVCSASGRGWGTRCMSQSDAYASGGFRPLQITKSSQRDVCVNSSLPDFAAS